MPKLLFTVLLILPSNKRQIIEKAQFAYFPLEKVFEKRTEKQVGAIKSLLPSNKKDELKEIEGIFPQNLMNDFACAKFKEIIKFQDIIKKIIYIINKILEKLIILLNIYYLLFFKRCT